MLLRFLAFFIDCLLIGLLIQSVHEWFELPLSITVVCIEFLLIFLLVIFQYGSIGRTVGMMFCGLKLHRLDGHFALRFLCQIFPFSVFFGIPFVRFLNDHIAGNLHSWHWLMTQPDGVGVNGFREIQIALVSIFLAALAVPRFYGRDAAGWEIIGKYRVIKE